MTDLVEEKLLPDLNPDSLYEGRGLEVLEKLVNPALECSKQYDRLTAYFTVESLLAVGEGIDELWRRGGEMRLVIGLHDVPPEIIQASELDEPEAKDIVKRVRERLLEETTTIQDELHRDRLATIAWMLNDGLLKIRVACPVRFGDSPHGGIFHKKRLIFRDVEDNILVAVGSPNETVAGFHENIEELTVLRHWDEGQRPIAQPHIDSFEEIWRNERDYIQVVDIDDSFADDLLERLGSPDRPGNHIGENRIRIKKLLDTARDSPAYSVLSLDNVGLYPHQERVFVDALSRWPVRVLLADEVGLGKTMEAGAILSYLLRFGDVEEVTILAPANLLKQWQDELHHHFGRKFWRWDSSRQAYVRPDGTEWGNSLGGDPVGPDAPDKVLISAQLARGTKNRGHIYEGKDRFPDLLLVDEAHAARVRPTLDGSLRPTRLWRTLDDIVGQIPHVVFLTATPLQTNLEEYHALLDLLGLPGKWEDFEAYKRSLEILSKGEDSPSLQNAQWLLQLIGATVKEMNYLPEELSATEKELIDIARNLDGSPSMEAIMAVRGNWSSAYNLLIRLHPAHILTLRNSRSSLVERGYRFPERRFIAPALEVPPEVERFYDGLQIYIQEAYGDVENAADPDREISHGFAKSQYHQRTSSSLHSAVSSLRNRKTKIERIAKGFDSDWEILEEEFEEPELLDELEYIEKDPDIKLRPGLERAKAIESTYIDDLLGKLEGFIEGGELVDPKLEKMIEILNQHLPAEAVLIFSRYTDTLDACLEVYKEHLPEHTDLGFGMYTGSESWITVEGRQRKATKQDVKHALEDEDIRLVFCSEAAAEGLNLQAARVMINIDVPWNPAKLEQRIGRIARLGQPADEVLVYNLWYPDSVESKMYRRLTERKDLYDVAVGQSPEIISEAIRSRVTSNKSQGDIHTEKALENLSEVRQSLQHRAVQKVWGPPGEAIPLSTTVRQEFLRVIEESTTESRIVEKITGERLVVDDPDIGRLEAGSMPEDRSILTLNHEILEILSQQWGYTPSEMELQVIEEQNEREPIGLGIRKGNSVSILPPSDLPNLIELLINHETMDEMLVESDWLDTSTKIDVSEIHSVSRWLPNHDRMNSIYDSSFDEEIPKPLWTQSEYLNLRPI